MVSAEEPPGLVGGGMGLAGGSRDPLRPTWPHLPMVVRGSRKGSGATRQSHGRQRRGDRHDAMRPEPARICRLRSPVRSLTMLRGET